MELLLLDVLALLVVEGTSREAGTSRVTSPIAVAEWSLKSHDARVNLESPPEFKKKRKKKKTTTITLIKSHSQNIFFALQTAATMKKKRKEDEERSQGEMRAQDATREEEEEGGGWEGRGNPGRSVQRYINIIMNTE